MTTSAKPRPDFLQQLEAHKYTVREADPKVLQGFELYLVDFSDWKLRFSDKTPLIWVKAELLAQLSDQQLLEGLQDVANQQGWRHQVCLVLLEGDVVELRRRTAERYFPRFLIIDAAQARSVSTPHRFTAALLDLVCDQISISNLAPYHIGGGVEGNAFFGREREIDRLLRQGNACFAVLGIRRIGKTSLLREARRRLIEQGEPSERIVWLDCSTLSGPEHFVQEVVRNVNFRELPRQKDPARFLFHFPNFLERMSRMHGGKITIFLDEADQFLNWSRNYSDFSYALNETIRQSTNAQACRYIAAGFADLMKAVFDQRSPLYMMFELMELGPFEKRETEEVILRPMRSLRIRFENEGAVIARIHEDTQGHPLLVQFYCVELIKRLEQESGRVLTLGHVDGIYSSDTFKQFVVNTFRDNALKSDSLLVYALLATLPTEKTIYTQPEMYGALQRHGCLYTPEQIDQACDRLALAGVFIRSGEFYRFANQVLPRSLRANYNLEYLLTATKKEVVR